MNYPALNIEWDGVIGDRVSVDYKRTKFVKVSDETPSKEQIAAGSLTYLVEGEQKIADVLGGYVKVGVGCIWVAEFVIVINQPGIVVDNFVFPETGTYFVYNDENSRAVSLALPTKSVIVPIPQEFVEGLEEFLSSDQLFLSQNYPVLTPTQLSLISDVNAPINKLSMLKLSSNSAYNGASLQIDGYGIIINSSTRGSSKKFRITVDDTGTISATEVTA